MDGSSSGGHERVVSAGVAIRKSVVDLGLQLYFLVHRMTVPTGHDISAVLSAVWFHAQLEHSNHLCCVSTGAEDVKKVGCREFRKIWRSPSITCSNPLPSLGTGVLLYQVEVASLAMSVSWNKRTDEMARCLPQPTHPKCLEKPIS